MKKTRVVVTIIAVLVVGFFAGRSFWNKLERDEEADRLAASRGCGKEHKRRVVEDIDKMSADISDVRAAVEKFLHCQFDIHEKNDLLLRTAVRVDYVKAVESLLKAGANVHAKDDAALRIAINKESLEMTDLLLASGANPRVYENEPLRLAIRWGNKPIVERLLKAGVEPSSWDIDFAVRNDKKEIADMLMKAALK